MSAPGPCPQDVEGRHAWWIVYRFPWPWGIVFPKVRRCLFCGERGGRA